MNTTETKAGEVTRLLRRVQGGDDAAQSRLFELMYKDLRKLAAFQLRRELPNQTLQPTALVHEAYIRLFGSGPVTMNDRRHFLALAAQVMRRLLVDRARAKATLMRDSRAKVELSDAVAYSDQAPEEMLALEAALKRLAGFAPRQSRIVEMRFFGGMLEEEIAGVLCISTRTVKRDWTMAKAWLYGELRESTSGTGHG